MTSIERRLPTLELAIKPKVRWLVATDAADVESQRVERAALGDLESVEFVITGVPRS